MSSTLILEFDGWVLIRLPTDPDPADEPRGVSGYTFAFGDEPDLDRVVYLQPPFESGYQPRSHTPPIGVAVRNAFRVEVPGTTIPAFVNAPVTLLRRPMLENRNWTLTPAGFEPIHPFELRIQGDGVTLQRDAPLDANNPNQPLHEAPVAQIVAHGARGIEFEPATVGAATGIWDGVAVVTARHAALTGELTTLQASGGNPAKEAILEGRLRQLQFGLSNPADRRVGMRFFVERFGFPLNGKATVRDDTGLLGGHVDVVKPWRIDFWLGGWDPDLLCCFMRGSLQVPLGSSPTTR